jgi:hypothetical protein
MSGPYLKQKGRYIGVEPGTTEVYADRRVGNGWEEVRLTPHDDGLYDALFVASNLQLSIQPNGTLATRPAGTYAEYEQFLLTATADGLYRPGVPGTVLTLEGFEGAPSRSLSPLTRIEGHRMVSASGELIYGRGADAFLLYKRFLEGQSVLPQLEQLQQLGCNLIRVMGMFESLGGFDPKAYPHYYESITTFCAYCESYGIYVLWTCCAATQAFFSSDDQVLDHIRKTVDQLKQTHNALCSPVNEQGQHNNSINLARVKAEIDFGWLLHDIGSYGEDQPCSPPFGTHAVLHVNRRYSNSVRDCCILNNPNYENDHLQVGLDEPDRYGDEGNTSVEQSADAAGTAYTALFYVFHSMQGERGDVLTGNTLDCAKAAFQAMKGH